MKLSANARLALRKAITNHPNWNNAFRTANGYSLATMSRADYFAAAEKLGLNISAIIRDADTNGAHNGHARNEEAKDVFDNAEEIRVPESVKANGHEREWRNTEREARREMTRTLDNDDKATKLFRMIAEIAGSAIDANDVRNIVQEEISNLDISTGTTSTIRLEQNGVKVGEIKGAHPKLKTVLVMAQCRNADGFVPGIFLPGPAGSGKTFAAKQIAKTLNLPFHFNGSIGMAHELLGFIDANGCYHRTPFREAYENGGVYLFDEVDGSDNAAILALNAALAGDCATFPDGQIKRHADFVPVATANTWGMGANADYVGRAKLDGAFLDRFPGRVFWDYDLELEKAISGNPAFAERVQKARAKARELGLKVLITPRASMAGAAYIAGGMSHQEAAEVTYLANLTPDQRAMLGE